MEKSTILDEVFLFTNAKTIVTFCFKVSSGSLGLRVFLGKFSVYDVRTSDVVLMIVL